MAVTIPKNDRRAVWYFLIGLVLGALTEVLYPTAHHSIRFSLGYLIGVLLMAIPISLVCWAIWRGHYWAKVLLIAATMYGVVKPLFYFSELQVPELTPRLALLALTLIPRLGAVVILSRDLLRRPVAREAEVAAGHNRPN
jgi:sulfite exporter TauE/SafE